MKQYFESLKQEAPINRLRMLEDNCDDVREGFYYYDFEPDEIQDLKEVNATTDVDLYNLAEERKRLIDPIDKKIKELKAAKAATVQNIKEGREQRQGKQFIFHDEDDMRTYILDAEANIISEMPLLKKQKTIYEPIRNSAAL